MQLCKDTSKNSNTLKFHSCNSQVPKFKNVHTSELSLRIHQIQDTTFFMLLDNIDGDCHKMCINLTVSRPINSTTFWLDL